jgi:thiamine pyrophosphate-dependent acetolactate synthase large subunit-like protein
MSRSAEAAKLMLSMDKLPRSLTVFNDFARNPEKCPPIFAYNFSKYSYQSERSWIVEAIRSIQTVANGEIHLQLPQHFWGQEVEIIVLPSPQQATNRVTPKKSLRGSLKHYAKPDRIAQEQNVWLMAMDEKQANR